LLQSKALAKELTHILIAQSVLKKLEGSGRQRLTKILEKHLSAFYLGAIIPDAFFYHIVPFNKTSQASLQVAQALHSKDPARNDQSAVGLFDTIKINPHIWPSKVAFAAGVVTHTVSDRIIHGIIDDYLTKWNQKNRLALASHRQLETLIDMVLLRRLGLYPRDLKRDCLPTIDKPTMVCLFRFYLEYLIGEKSARHPSHVMTLRRAHTQQRLFLKLFMANPLYHIMNLSNKLLAGRLAVWASLFYPGTIGTQTFPILDQLTLNAHSNGCFLMERLPVIVETITTDAICHIDMGLKRLA